MVLPCLGGQGLDQAWLGSLVGHPVYSTSSPRCSFSVIPFLLSLLVSVCSGSPGAWLCWL